METSYILIALILGSFVVTYHVFYLKDIFKVFMLLTLMGIIGYWQWNKVVDAKQDDKDTSVYFDDLQKKIDLQFVIQNLYGIHKYNGKLKHVRRHKEIVKFIKNINLINIYDPPTFQKVVVLLEYYLKIHFYIMIGKYESSLYLPVLSDIHLEILNTLSQSIFIMPRVSRVLDIENIDVYMENRTKDIDSILQNFQQMIHNKYCQKGECDHIVHKPPKAFDGHDPHILYV
jgi:hypothetical protein